jgi:glycine/D-amino acid oxidase-like deaminating enzyme
VTKRTIVDRVVVGAGVFGLHAAALLLNRGYTVAVVDGEHRPLVRASLVNQARVHNGYHYPRSAYTALRSARYYERFVADFPDAINRRFRAVYAVAAQGSYVDAEHFEKFCDTVGVPARRIEETELFRPGSVEAAYETDEYGFDAPALRAALLDRLDRHRDRLDWHLGDTVTAGERDAGTWRVRLRSGGELIAGGVVNATYAATNAVLSTFGLEPVRLKYELCEVALVDAAPLRDTGVTVMDGPFLSLMPFGHSGRHSLTAVDYTPRVSSSDLLPTFGCQSRNPGCGPAALANCGVCPERPASSFPYMDRLAHRFLRHAGEVRLVESLNSVKVVLQTTEVDDARPTLIRVEAVGPLFVTLFSGKINTIYDLDEVL